MTSHIRHQVELLYAHPYPHTIHLRYYNKVPCHHKDMDYTSRHVLDHIFLALAIVVVCILKINVVPLAHYV